MAQSGYTPIQLYYSTTAAATPSAGNLASGELALNIQDEKLYFKNAAGTVKLLASNAATTNVASFQTSLGGLTPSIATTGVVTLAGTLNTSSGGTGLTSYTAGDLPYYATGTALSKLGIGSAGQILTSTGSAPQWSTLSGVAVTTISFGTTGLTPSSATSGAITVAGTLATTNGGTGLTSFSANQIFFASSSSAIGQSSNLTWNGSTLAVTGAFTATADSTFSSTGALTISKGTTAQQPGSPVTGMLRYNTTTNQFEGYSGSSPAWNPVGGASLSNDTSTSSNVYPLFANATSGSATTIFTSNAKLLYKPSTGEFQSSVIDATNGIFVNSQTVAADYTIAATDNGLSAGPVTVNSGITVTVSSGAVWTVV